MLFSFIYHYFYHLVYHSTFSYNSFLRTVFVLMKTIILYCSRTTPHSLPRSLHLSLISCLLFLLSEQYLNLTFYSLFSRPSPFNWRLFLYYISTLFLTFLQVTTMKITCHFNHHNKTLISISHYSLHFFIFHLLSIKDGAYVNLQSHGGWTPLIYASVQGHTKEAEELIKLGAN